MKQLCITSCHLLNVLVMQHQDHSSSSHHLQPQPDAAVFRSRHPVLLDTIQPVQVRAIISPKRGMEEPLQLQTPQTPGSCSSPGPGGNSDMMAVLLVTVAGAVILLLLYKVLQQRHRLRLAMARHALEYSSFYHRATYRLKQDLPSKNGTLPAAAPPIQTITTVIPTIISPPTPPPPTHRSPSAPPTPRVLSLPLPLPVIHTTPPSPHLSWGACSDADVYSRIGAFRPSRISSLSSQSTVILFEHSAL